jgi:hypothetical protein
LLSKDVIGEYLVSMNANDCDVVYRVGNHARMEMWDRHGGAPERAGKAASFSSP